MLNPITLLADGLGEDLTRTYHLYFGDRKPEYASYLGGAARLVLERIGNSNALVGCRPKAARSRSWPNPNSWNCWGWKTGNKTCTAATRRPNSASC